jgi:hypothetical protein
MNYSLDINKYPNVMALIEESFPGVQAVTIEQAIILMAAYATAATAAPFIKEEALLILHDKAKLEGEEESYQEILNLIDKAKES